MPCTTLQKQTVVEAIKLYQLRNGKGKNPKDWIYDSPHVSNYGRLDEDPCLNILRLPSSPSSKKVPSAPLSHNICD